MILVPPALRRWHIFGCLLILLVLEVRGQVPEVLLTQQSITSVSGQFVVHGERPRQMGLDPSPLKPVGLHEVIELTPQLAVVSCDRIRRAVQAQLDLPEEWHGKVHVFLSSVPKVEQPIRIVPERFTDGWQYRVFAPRRCDWRKWVRAIVEAFLLEQANRHSESHVAAIPLWLTEGVTAMIVGEHGRDLVTEPHSFNNRNERRPDPLAVARETLSEKEPHSFSEIGLPSSEKLTDPMAWKHFQASSQVLVYEMMNQSDTRLLIRTLLPNLPRQLNWQTVFMQISQPLFLSPLEVEKWWALAVVHFREETPGVTWSRGRGLRELRQIVQETIREHGASTSDSPPIVGNWSQIPLSSAVERFEGKELESLVHRKNLQCQLLRPHLDRELRGVVDGLILAMDRLSRGLKGDSNSNGQRGALGPRARILAKDTMVRLRQIEARVAEMSK